MWYLQTDVLLRLFIACGAMILISGLSRLIFKKDFGPKVLVFASIAVIAYVSWQLAIAIVCYTLITFIFARILKPLKKTRRFFFVLFSILCTVPFFYGRMTEFFPQLPVIITFVGIAYHMLKAVDVMYFVYYTDMDIPFLTYVNYMLFFPTFTAGPIFRYRDFQKVYNKPVPLTTDRFITCVKRFIKGMFKKMVVLYFVSTFFNFLGRKRKTLVCKPCDSGFQLSVPVLRLVGLQRYGDSRRLGYGIYSARKLQKALGGGIIYTVLA